MSRAVHLLVRSPFGEYQENDRITDPAKVKEVLDGPHALHVLQTPAVEDDTDPPKPRSRGASKE